MLSIPWSPPDPDLELLQVTSTDDSILLVVKSPHTSASCPVCLKPSSHKHSQYSRKVQDIPISNKTVELLVLTRRWFCDQPDCNVKIFTERYDWLSCKGRRTKRTEEILRKVAFSTSCLSAEKVARSVHIPVSHDTLLNLVRRTHIEPEVSPFCWHWWLCFCKGHTYGTLICDLQSKVPLAILPDRLPRSVTDWLIQHPYIEVVSRDGFTSFRQGISNANSQIIQIYDRWHFIRNAKKQLDSILLTLIPATVTLGDPDPPLLAEIPLTCAEQLIKNRQSKKWELIQEIKQAQINGKNISRLSREYKLDRRTISKYITMNEPPAFRALTRGSSATNAFRSRLALSNESIPACA